MEYAERAMVPGGFLVDMFPIRSFCPRFPGSCPPLLIRTEVKLFQDGSLVRRSNIMRKRVGGCRNSDEFDAVLSRM